MFLRPAEAVRDLVAGPHISWEDAPCPLCGSRESSVIFEAADVSPAEAPGLRFPIARCRSCSMTYTNPRPDESSIGSFYPADYRPHRRPRKMRQVAKPSAMGRWTGRSHPERDGALPWVGRGRLLDFGCGGGSYLKRMADQGWTVVGLDAALGAVRSIQEELGLQAIVGTLPHEDLKPCSFDVVTMWHSLEHVHKPLAILREAFQLLIPGGKLVVACPNIASWPFRAFGESWFGLDLPRHLSHFTPETLRTMLTAAGFEVEEIRPVRHSDWLRSSAKLAVKSGTANWWQQLLTRKPLAKFAAWVNYLFHASDCMMAVAQRPE